jgi:hypothetical protein
LVLNS